MMHCKIEIEVTEDEDGISFNTTRQGNNVPKPIYLMALEYAKFQLMDLIPGDEEEQ
jgi:hypothetical protein